MTNLLRVIVVDSDPGSRAALRDTLSSVPGVAVVGEHADLPQALRDAGSRSPDLFLVELPASDPGHEADAAGRIQQVVRAFPEAAVVAMAPTVSANFVLQAMRAGAVEFLPRPVQPPDLAAALEKLFRMRHGMAPARRPSTITSVFSTKGGLGVTTVAINVAVCLAERAPGRALLVELDSRQSDIATFLDLRPTYSVIDAFENLNRLDESFLRGLLSRHKSGLWVLPGPSRMERAQLGPEQVRRGLELMRAYFDHIVIDLRHDLDPGTLAALELSDTILFLTSLNVSALRSGAAGLAAFRHLGLDLQRVKIIVMREDTGEDVTLRHAREALGLPMFWKTPSDYQTVVGAINAGQPVVTASPRSRVAKNLRQLAEALAASPGGDSEPSAKGAASLLRFVWTPKGMAGGG
jgi:pilus assembly protein CpaE